MTSCSDIGTARAVVFDVDGTLYDGAGLRRRMLVELLLYCARDPRRLPLLRTIYVYRAEREALADEEVLGISRRQYEQPAHRLGVPASAVRDDVDSWIHERPLRHLSRYAINGVAQLFSLLRGRGTKLAVLSDYPATSKLAALGLEADHVVCATDPEIDRLKPHPAGLLAVLDHLDLDPADCLLVGDRDDRDGEVARRTGMPFLLRRRRPRAEHEFRNFAELATRL